MNSAHAIRAKARKYLAAAGVAVRNRWRYPAEMVGPLVTYCLFVFVFARIWVAAFAGKSEIAGYGRADCTWYFVFAELCLFASNGAFASLSREIKDGQVAYTLGRPYGLLAYNWAQRLGLALSQAPLFLAGGWLIASLAAGPWIPDSPLRLAALALAFLLSASLQYFLQAAIAMTAFWFEENSAFFWLFSKISLVAGTLMPLEFLPDAWQRALLWTPFPWMVWAPARVAVAPAADLPALAFLLGGQALWLAAAAAIAQAIYRLAVRRTTIQGG
jgi:ABC-2 type transport system permease protein